MSLALWLWAALAAAPADGLAPGEHEALLTVQVLADAPPPKEYRPGAVQPFYRQDLLQESGIILKLSPEALKAFRAQHDFEDNDPIMLMEWLALEAGKPSRHLAYLHCARGGTYGTGPLKACFRDTDGDGRIDAVAAIQSRGLPTTGIHFSPIEPVAYDYRPSARKPRPYSMYVQPGIGIAWRRDEATGKLLFRAQAVAASLRADLEPFVEVDPAHLPATIELAGASLTVLSWNGKRPTVRIDRPMTERPVRVMNDAPPGFLPPHGTPKGWRLEIVDDPLPGAPR